MGQRTEAQRRATMRNWGIRQLRALSAQTHMLAPARGRAVRSIIDEELSERGAETEYERETKRMLAAALADEDFAEVGP